MCQNFTFIGTFPLDFSFINKYYLIFLVMENFFLPNFLCGFYYNLYIFYILYKYFFIIMIYYLTNKRDFL